MQAHGTGFVARRNLARWSLIVASAGLTAVAYAGSFDLGNGVQGTYKIVGNYAIGVRTGEVENSLINGPIDPFVAGAGPLCTLDQAGQTACFSHTGLPTSINFDDANRNFKQWSLISNRASVFGQVDLNSGPYGIVVSGNGFYDRVYHTENDNDSPSTVNKTGPNNQFTEGSSRYDGYRFRLLETYAYGEFPVNDEMSLNLRFGKQVVAYGESLFLSGISSTMGPFDATKAFVAGAEVKDIILPETRIAAQFSLTTDLTLVGEYQLDYSPTEIFSNGSYFSPADIVGPGATFAYGSENPAVHPCPGLLPGGADAVCDLNTQLGLVGLLVDGPSTINVQRGPDIMPDKYGHYSVGVKYQLAPTLTLGYFHTRYADHNPSVVLNPGFAYIGTVTGCGAGLPTCSILPTVANGLLAPLNLPIGTRLDTNLFGVLRQYVPVTYNIAYADNIMLDGLTFSTVLGPFNVAGEFNYRRNLPISVQVVRSGVLSPENSRGDLSQVLISALYTNNPRFIADEVTFVGEMGAIYVNNVEAIKSSPGTYAVGSGDELFYDRFSYGFQTLTFATVRNIIDGWDLQTPVSFGMLFKNPSMAGAFGPLYGDGDTRLSFGAKMQYLQNLEFALNYNMFFGDVDKMIGNSTLHANPYLGRDYATFNVKYSL